MFVETRLLGEGIAKGLLERRNACESVSSTRGDSSVTALSAELGFLVTVKGEEEEGVALLLGSSAFRHISSGSCDDFGVSGVCRLRTEARSSSSPGSSITWFDIDLPIDCC